MTPDGGGDGVSELTEAEKIRLQAAKSDISAMNEGLNNDTATPEDVDAGEHAAAIEGILRRIPDGWGRYLSIDAGWHPLVITTDQQLARLDPDYRVLQIKEKVGTLRYYCRATGEDPVPGLLDAMDAITDGAERASAIVCERCGEPGTLHQSRHGRVKTLCAACAERLGYVAQAH